MKKYLFFKKKNTSGEWRLKIKSQKRKEIKDFILKKVEDSVNEVLRYRINTSRKIDKLIKRYKKLEQKIWVLFFKDLTDLNLSREQSRKISIKEMFLKETRDEIYFKLTGIKKPRAYQRTDFSNVDNLPWSQERKDQYIQETKKIIDFVAEYKAFFRQAERFGIIERKKSSKRSRKKAIKNMYKKLDQ